MPRVILEVSDDELEFLRRLARRNNTSVNGALLSSAFGKARKMPPPLESLFNELVILAGSIRALYAKVKPDMDADTLIEINRALERVDELADITWELIKVNKLDLLEAQEENGKAKRPVQLDLI